MPDAVDQVLQLVAAGRLTAEEAAPILDALEGAAPSTPGPSGGGAADERATAGTGSSTDRPRFARIEVFEHGRTAVNLRVPLSLGRMALAAIPGLAGPYASQVDQAISNGTPGAVLDVTDEDGDGVRVVLE